MTSAVTQSNGFERVIPVWLGDLLIILVAGVLLALAIRRGATAYLLPAGLGVIVALSDINATYVASSVGAAVALLLEGLILLGVGVAAGWLRARVVASGPDGPDRLDMRRVAG